MMKTYVKPKIYFESFALSESIATACTWIERNDGTNKWYENTDLTGGWDVTVLTDNCDTKDGEIYCITMHTDSIVTALVGSV